MKSNTERLNTFPLAENKQTIPDSTRSSNQRNTARKKKHIDWQELELSLLADDVTERAENPTESTKRTS